MFLNFTTCTSLCHNLQKVKGYDQSCILDHMMIPPYEQPTMLRLEDLFCSIQLQFEWPIFLSPSSGIYTESESIDTIILPIRNAPRSFLTMKNIKNKLNGKHTCIVDI